MLVLTIDQRRSRDHEDQVDGLLELLRRAGAGRLAAEPERTVGDEVQVATEDADCAVELLLAVQRNGGWHIGLGVGGARRPLPSSVRSASGEAFVAARSAVEEAKESPFGVAVRSASDEPGGGGKDAAEFDALLNLLLALRERRTAAGWQIVDLVEGGRSQGDAARLLGVSAQAVSLRLRAAGWRLEAAARPALTTLLATLDHRLDPPEER